MNPLLALAGRPVIGHRGAAASAPENTIESFRLALQLGAEALELDVRAAADGEAVVIHDPELDRTTDQRGPVAGWTVSQLKRADAGYRFATSGGDWSFRGRGVRIPTLREVLRTFPDVPLLVEIKERAVQRDVARAIAESAAHERVVVAGEDYAALAPFRNPPFVAGASRRDIAWLYFGGLVGMAPGRTGCRSYAVPTRFGILPVPTRRFARQAHARGATVHVWTVDQPEEAQALWELGVNGIVTNRPELIRGARGDS